MENNRFEDLPISTALQKAVLDLGFEEPTPIQMQAIPVIRSGRDVIGQSRTGTGKTAAFGLPLLDSIDPEDRSLQLLVLCPTRELAIQVSEEFRKYLKYSFATKVLPVYGGQPIDRQIFALRKGVQVVIGTPGRVMDHIRRHTLKLETLRFVVLDEADEMLDMGFREDIDEILRYTPQERQTVLFSATMSKEILDLSQKYLRDPLQLQVVRKDLTVPTIQQAYFDVKAKTKTEALCRIMDLEAPHRAIVFCNTKKRTDELVEELQGRGYFAEALHGDLKQAQRDSVLSRFRSGAVELLVATDVAARGLDVDDVDIVFNYDIPQDEEYYVHRIGRTGRAGKNGVAYTFVVGKEIYKLRDIMRYAKTTIPQHRLPTLVDIEEARMSAMLEKVRGTIEEGHLGKYVSLVETLLDEDYAALDIAAALFRLSLPEETTEGDDLFDSGSGRYGDPGRETVRLFLNVGKKDRIRVKDVVGAMAGETGIPGNVIGAIEMYDDFTFVNIPAEYQNDVLRGMKDCRIKGKKVILELAKKEKGKHE